MSKEKQNAWQAHWANDIFDNMFTDFHGGMDSSSRINTERMEILRCGNICIEASGKDWTIQRQRAAGRVFFVFISPDHKRRVTGRPCHTERHALISACDALYENAFLQDEY